MKVDPRLIAFTGAALFVLIGMWLVGRFTRTEAKPPKWVLSRLIDGADCRLSTSKFQALVWTVVVLYGYLAVFIERLWFDVTAPDPSVPTNLLIAMGFSATTMAVAKGITVSYANNGMIDKTRQVAPLGGLVTDDDGVPELAKLQMLAFTAVAVIVYLVRLARRAPATAELVDIDPALMVLMGLSQGAYLGKKLVTTETPQLTGMSPTTGQAGQRVTLTLTGIALGDSQGGSSIKVDGTTIGNATTWSDTSVQFTMPTERAPGRAWAPGDHVQIIATVNGREAAAPVQFVFRA